MPPVLRSTRGTGETHHETSPIVNVESPRGMTTTVWALLGATGIVGLLSPFALRPVLHRLGVLDVPNFRSSHARPTLRGGGVAPLIALLTGGLPASVLLHQSGSDYAPLVAIVTVGAVMGLVGLMEDLRGLPVAIRAGSQLLAGTVLASAFAAALQPAWFWVPVAAVGFAAYVNFANFMDGVNGISSLHGFVAGSAYAVIGLLTGQAWLSIAGALLAVAFLSFLPWNLTPPGMFLGDVGSYLLGGTLAALAILTLAHGLHPLAAVAPLSVYFADTVFTLIRRASWGEPILEAHRSHTYQRLTNTGISHMAVSLLVAVFTGVISTVAVLVALSTIPLWGGLLTTLALLSIYLSLPRLRGDVLVAPIDEAFPPVSLPGPSEQREKWEPQCWAVIGASGFVGDATASHLEASGYTVRRLTAPRVQSPPTGVDGPTVSAAASMHPATSALARELAGADVVINAAGAAAPDSGPTHDLFGANALLPAIVAHASAQASVGRVLHLSSAAVQGHRTVLDDSTDVAPFSPYSHSKALGERAILAALPFTREAGTNVSIIRATSVQGDGRKTTENLRRVASSFISSVSAPGTQPTVVSSLEGLVRFIQHTGLDPRQQPVIQLQPWEGLSVSDVLRLAGGKNPAVLPRWLCRSIVRLGQLASSILPDLAGPVRRVELMWFGQKQLSHHSSSVTVSSDFIRAVLQEGTDS